MEEVFLSETESICPECFTAIPARRVARGDRVYLRKTCPEHGSFEAVIWRGLPACSSWVRPKTPSYPENPSCCGGWLNDAAIGLSSREAGTREPPTSGATRSSKRLPGPSSPATMAAAAVHTALARPRNLAASVLPQWPSPSVTTVMLKPGTRRRSDGRCLGIPARSCRTTGRSAGCGRSSQEAAARWPGTRSSSLTKTRPRAGFPTTTPGAPSSACMASQFVSLKACAGLSGPPGDRRHHGRLALPWLSDDRASVTARAAGCLAPSEQPAKSPVRRP